METQHPKSMQLILPELRRRLVTPCGYLTFYLHLIGGVVLFGGAGVYYTIWKSHGASADISIALLGYFTPLVGAALLEFDMEEEPYLRSFGIFAFIIFIVIAILVVTTECHLQLGFSCLGTFMGIAFWWVAHGLNTRFQDVKAQNALGGDTSVELPKSSDKGWLQ
jgi:hypothetical protein